MVLVDTSVWISLFRQRSTPTSVRLREMLEQGLPFGITSVIYQELLQGAKDESDYQQLQDYLGTQHFCHPLDQVESYASAARIYFDCRRRGVTIRSTIDCLIAQIAIEHQIVLLHEDDDFSRMAEAVDGLKVWR
ncbi:MAG: PIN domain nuclease [Mariprofundaceae bacterium]|nr:PIN domain nuclease [Mariprofundaceae bacterium]